uniref:Odorant-binding protein 11 n=1 Tax=Tropidothorax elegans TaxID=2233830 RepID=A0A2Z5EMC3_9HEMI|nr:odorant-binding protein 11 [Tropidothorax elegans]
MTSFRSALLFSVLLATCSARPDDGSKSHLDFAEKEKKILEECNKEIHAPESAIEHLLLMEEIDDSKEGKCLLKCAMTAFQIMQEDGHLDEEKTLAYIHHAYSKPETQAKVKEIADACIEQVEKVEDNCEHAYNFLKCFITEAKKNNIPKIHEEKH